MHLTDEQLLSDSEAKASTHLAECDSCQQRLLHLQAIRSQLEVLPEVEPVGENWNAVWHEYQLTTSQERLRQTQKKSRVWQFTSMALAASLIVAISWNGIFVTEQKEMEKLSPQIASLIEQNNYLQQQISQLKQFNNSRQPVAVASYWTQKQLLLDEIDNQIQKAYLANDKVSAKKQLWQQRQQVLQEMLLASQKQLEHGKRNKQISL